MDAKSNQYVEIRKNSDGQDRPFLNGTRVKVQDLVLLHERFNHSVDEIARQYPHLSIAQVHGALAYFFEDRQAIWKCIHDDEAFLEQMKAQQSAKSAQGSIETDAGSASISS